MARKIEFIPEEKIVEAMDVFWSRGYTAASLSDLTTAMHLNKCSMYNTIGNKHTLFKECLKTYYDKLVERDFKYAMNKGKTALEKLDCLVDGITVITLKRNDACFGIKSSFETAGRDEDIKTIIRAANEKRINLVRVLISTAQTEGDINANRDSSAMAYFFIYAFTGMTQARILHNPETVEMMGREIKAYLRS